MDRANRRPSLPDAPATRERQGGMRAVGVAVSRVAAPVVRRRGGGILVRLKAHWREIVGDEWAAASWPMALGRDGALRLRVAPGAALELQHRAPLVIERITLFFGRAVVHRLSLLQAPPPFAPAAAVPEPPLLAPAQEALLAASLGGVADPELRAALAGLGRAVVSSESRSAAGIARSDKTC